MELVRQIQKYAQEQQLTNPGSFEGLHREVCLTQRFFEGGKADLAKTVSNSFQVSHAFTLGTPMMPQTYHFGAIFATKQQLMHGVIDTNGIFQGKYHLYLDHGISLKTQSQLSKQPGQSMVQVELDLAGPTSNVNVRLINPDPASQTGIFTGSLMQSLAKNWSAGAELIAQKMQPQEPCEVGHSLALKHTTPKAIFTASLQQMTAVQLSYFHRVTEQVELGTEMQLLAMGPRSDALTTVAAKFDYKQACVRAQVDTAGKVGMLYEERLMPGFSLTMAAELDHLKGGSRVGLGINLEN